VEVVGGDPSVDIIDIELPGHRRAHLQLGHGEPQIAVRLIPEDRLAAMVDQVRGRAPDAPPAEVAALGQRVGARRVLALAPDGGSLLVRWFDVAQSRWGADAVRVDLGQPKGMDALLAYATPAPPVAPVATVKESAHPQAAKSRWGAWSKWYTWVAAGAVVALVGGLLIAEHVGSDSLKVTVTH
jgi:hypothetical protein